MSWQWYMGIEVCIIVRLSLGLGCGLQYINNSKCYLNAMKTFCYVVPGCTFQIAYTCYFSFSILSNWFENSGPICLSILHFEEQIVCLVDLFTQKANTCRWSLQDILQSRVWCVSPILIGLLQLGNSHLLDIFLSADCLWLCVFVT